MSGQAVGVDVSSWQHPGNKPIDWFAVADAGYTFAMVKASQGVGYTNPWLDRDLDDAYAAGLHVGAYHFYEAGQPIDGQAALFIGALVGRTLAMGAWLDWEPGELPAWTAAQDVKAFLDAVAAVRARSGLYCDQSWLDQLRGAQVTVGNLWLAAPSLADAPVGALLWQRPAVPVPGIEGLVDIDVLTSTRGVNIPTSPPARPTAATAVPVKVPDEPDELPEDQPD